MDALSLSWSEHQQLSAQQYPEVVSLVACLMALEEGRGTMDVEAEQGSVDGHKQWSEEGREQG